MIDLAGVQDCKKLVCSDVGSGWVKSAALAFSHADGMPKSVMYDPLVPVDCAGVVEEMPAFAASMIEIDP